MKLTPNLEAAIEALNKGFDDDVVFFLSKPPKIVDSISSGALALDVELGCGGYPRGRVIEIFGPESSGKTTLALHAIAEAQKAGGWAAFIDAEHALNVKYAADIGINIPSLLLSQPSCGEDALEVTDQLVRSGDVSIVVIDSVSALVPKAELEGEMGEMQIGLQARLMSQALRKLIANVHKSNTLVIFINQIRMKIGGYGNPEVTCVTPDTIIEIQTNNSQSVSMEDLFNLAGVNYRAIEKNLPIDISDRNIKVKSFNHETGRDEFKKILFLVRKEDCEICEVRTLTGDLLLRATKDHRVYDNQLGKYIQLGEYLSPASVTSLIHLRTNAGQAVEGMVFLTGEIEPILDMGIEGNENYYSNGILSHNSGGNSLKFYASQRLETRRGEFLKNGEDIYGQKIKVNIKKNRLAPPYREVLLDLIYGKGVDKAGSLLETAVGMGIVEQTGAYYIIEGKKVHGRAAIVEVLSDPVVFKEIEAKARAVLKGSNG